MPVNYSYLVKHTTVKVQDNAEGIQLSIDTPRLIIRSVEERDIPFFQSLWANPVVMEKFAAGEPRLYSGSDENKTDKAKNNAEYDYALWRIKTDENSWLNKRKANNIWHGLIICDKEAKPIGHIVLGGGELAYFLLPDVWKQGYANEAAVSLICIALPYISKHHTDIKIPSVINATVRIDHEASQKILSNVGFEINKETTPISEKFGHTRFEVSAPSSKFIEKYNQQLSMFSKVSSGAGMYACDERKQDPNTIQEQEKEITFQF